MRKASRDKHCQWLIAMIPTKEWADYIMPDVEESKRLEELWKLLLKLCYIDETNDVVQTWKEKGTEIMKEERKLMRIILRNFTIPHPMEQIWLWN